MHLFILNHKVILSSVDSVGICRHDILHRATFLNFRRPQRFQLLVLAESLLSLAAAASSDSAERSSASR